MAASIQFNCPLSDEGMNKVYLHLQWDILQEGMLTHAPPRTNPEDITPSEISQTQRTNTVSF